MPQARPGEFYWRPHRRFGADPAENQAVPGQLQHTGQATAMTSWALPKKFSATLFFRNLQQTAKPNRRNQDSPILSTSKHRSAPPGCLRLAACLLRCCCAILRGEAQRLVDTSRLIECGCESIASSLWLACITLITDCRQL